MSAELDQRIADLEAEKAAMEEEFDELEKKLAEVTAERDSLQRENTELVEKIDTAKDQVEEVLRGLNK